MIKAIIAGFDRAASLAIEEVGKRSGVEIKTESVFIQPNYFAQATDFGSAYTFARRNAHAAIKEAPHGDIFTGLQSMLRRRSGGWEHLIGIQIVSRYRALLCGTWTEAVPVPLELIDEVKSRGMTTANLETVLSHCYGADAADPYGRLSGGRSRRQMLVEALLRAPDRRRLIEH
jgi:hypothetical protein